MRQPRFTASNLGLFSLEPDSTSVADGEFNIANYVLFSAANGPAKQTMSRWIPRVSPNVNASGSPTREAHATAMHIVGRHLIRTLNSRPPPRGTDEIFSMLHIHSKKTTAWKKVTLLLPPGK
jgi:hypothetical protein